MLLFAAPGAGLGHLVRVSAISLALSDLGLKTRILTNSVYGRGLGRITGLAIDHIPSRHWVGAIDDYLEHQKPELIVLDTFPWGLRGEWNKDRFPRARFAYLARRLNIPAYLQVAGGPWETHCPPFELVIRLEPLTDPHLYLLENNRPVIKPLPGPVRFPAENFMVPVPTDLEKILLNHPTWLVVHSGPLDEIRQLCVLARQDMARCKDGLLAVIHPHLPGDEAIPFFEYFPASQLYGLASRIITGAGYNSLADRTTCPEKHILKAFPRRYDDQAGRLSNMNVGRENGAPIAARLLADLLS